MDNQMTIETPDGAFHAYNGDVPSLCLFITGRADVGVHAEQFLENDYGRCR